MKLKIKVTQEHIDKGNKCDFSYCPLARALKDTGYHYVHIDSEAISTRILGDYKSFYHTKKSLNFMNRFDKGLKVKPSTFTFNIGK